MSSRRSLTTLGLPSNIFKRLVQQGYTTLEDLKNVTPEALEKDFGFPHDTALNLIDRCRNPVRSLRALTQPVARLVEGEVRLLTRCPTLDKFLDGGLPHGHVLEVSGPPGSPKELLSINILASALERNDEVIFIDCQNTSSPSLLNQKLAMILSSSTDWRRFVHYGRLHTLADLLLFLNRLSSFLQSHPKIALVVIGSISSPFQSTHLSVQQRKGHLELVKQAFSRVTALHGLAVVTTCQMATKMVNPDGSYGSFDSGAKGIMVPQLGSAYLPSGKSYQVILAPDGLDSGFVSKDSIIKR
ncbi:hypothetical protein CVT26_004767 [Gymnopilus dilepis]|uniref:RecA family profile 1 domain-containing protein n=1 Tax=Gymnopilus dilepis TaxID=231916 RepID=A0A409XZD1_9AGAR|nr:hypothetical protein CVT26_004767 [Gymnopilus dilepis]